MEARSAIASRREVVFAIVLVRVEVAAAVLGRG